MEVINDHFLRKKNLKNFNSLIIEIEDIAGSIEEFLRRRNFGYCLIYKKTEIVCWCISFLHGFNCEAWVQTVEKYQKKGFATFTVAAFVEYYQNHNIAIGWHSNLDNQGSIKLAEKVGFERTSKEYSWVFGDHQE
ncbi:MAG: GNAT family N-acetyltransferase [Candidatus Hodarchaeota archaeon]